MMPKPRYQPLDSRMLGETVIFHGHNRVPFMTPQELAESKQRYRLWKKEREEAERRRVEEYRNRGGRNGSSLGQ
jgi:hypothetical protein